MNRDLRLLFAGRALRSLSQSYLTILVPIYVAELKYDALHVGYLFTASAIASTVLAGAVGLLSDRWGRRNLLVVISAMTAAAGMVFALWTNFAALMLAASLGTVGRSGPAGAGGGFGPFYPAEQALVAEHAGNRSRTAVFGTLAFVGVFAGAAGSLCAATPALLHRWFEMSMLSGYRSLFWFTTGVGIAMVIVAIPLREGRLNAPIVPEQTSGRTQPGPLASAQIFGLSRNSWKMVARFALINGTNGLAVGMLGPFVVYWFYRRFAVSAAQLANLFFLINLAVGIPNLAAGRISRRLGAVKTVVSARAASAVFLLLTVLMPTYLAAAIMYALRSLTGAIGIPVRQSYLMGLIDPAERATAAGFTNLPLQVTSLAGPYTAGVLMESFWIGLPIEIAAFLQGVVALMFHALFSNIRPPEEHVEAHSVPLGRSETGDHLQP